MKKRSWLVVGGVAILVAVAAIAYHMGKRARLSDIDVVVTCGGAPKPDAKNAE